MRHQTIYISQGTEFSEIPDRNIHFMIDV